jgi:hypothetical protein
MGVIFRRGPSGWVRLVKWHTDTDEIERGQWFHGRIYEKRCDLTPNGELLVYFAAKRSESQQSNLEYTTAWTAISKPPYLTALALWPKGDSWHGGGLFGNNKRLLLNHRPDVAKPHKDHMPQNLRVDPNAEAYGEDSPIYDIHLMRDGWKLRQELETHEIKYALVTDKPEIYSKQHPKLEINLLMFNSTIKYRLVSNYSLELHESKDEYSIDGAEWADWDQRGRLVYTSEGKLFAADVDITGAYNPVQIADFNDDKPSQVPPPEWATVW